MINPLIFYYLNKEIDMGKEKKPLDERQRQGLS